MVLSGVTPPFPSRSWTQVLCLEEDASLAGRHLLACAHGHHGPASTAAIRRKGGALAFWVDASNAGNP